MKKYLLLLMPFALAGCVATGMQFTQPGDSGLRGLRQADDGTARVVVSGSALAGAKPVRVQFEDPWEFEEYALFPGTDGSQTEVIYIAARHGTNNHVALEYGRLISDTVVGWNISQRQKIDWQPSQWISTRWGGAWAQPYRLRQANRSCVGFSAGWDDMQDDPQIRPSKAIFGYHCATPGKTLPFADAVAAVQAVGIRGITESIPVASAYDLGAAGKTRPPLAREKAIELAVIAQNGSPGQPSGHPGFPFLLSEIYHVGGGDDAGFE